jgi:small basic protein
VRDTGYGVRDTEKTAVNYVGQHEGVALLEAEAVVCMLQRIPVARLGTRIFQKIYMITKRMLHLW